MNKSEKIFIAGASGMAGSTKLSLEDGVRETYDWFVNKSGHWDRDSI